MDNQANPALIQKGEPTRAPLFLIHDAGGTVSHYYKLDKIGRPVYTIHNPWFKAETKWDGGSMTFVNEYIKLIKSVVPSGEIIVGGWSLGGQLAIDIARVLAQNSRSRLRVVGLVLVDTMYPYWGPPDTVHAEFPVDLVLKNCPPDIKENMIRCMQWSKQDSDEWVSRNWKTDDNSGLDGIEAMVPPDAVLLHAQKYVPVADPQTASRCMVDYLRDDKVGWNHFPHQFIAAVWEMPTHHFGLFEKTTVRETTEKIRRACDLLAED
ncbi:Alpha/Beta hydrolase protein [Massariosphaeria phaeospora]|uniref:Alpha/Beta hydrolase protein n=1 Tax=Massariosphaeria phaeospora TaxID=100035 RepID=A0A7C8IBX2_9PLEO|nr:Alpha/Beta hydrolase protein [Massariosphaeria phaeospora]